ncbi:MAG TPA: hypothetical protein VJN89_04845 [Candidatus Acidoferrum sp.]|nr:hypothetical protein [Candidatus Acidoferrum sp.]
MKVLIPDDRCGHRDSLRKLIQREREVHVSGITDEAEGAPGSAIARELRRALDGCPICDGSYRDHSYSILATVAIVEQWHSPLRVNQYYDCLQNRSWQELLRIREWNGAADTLIGFAFRCSLGRVGIVTMLSPADPSLPDTPLHYTILPEEEGKKLLALLPPEKWRPLRPAPPASL